MRWARAGCPCRGVSLRGAAEAVRCLAELYSNTSDLIARVIDLIEVAHAHELLISSVATRQTSNACQAHCQAREERERSLGRFAAMNSVRRRLRNVC